MKTLETVLREWLLSQPHVPQPEEGYIVHALLHEIPDSSLADFAAHLRAVGFVHRDTYEQLIRNNWNGNNHSVDSLCLAVWCDLTQGADDDAG